MKRSKRLEQGWDVDAVGGMWFVVNAPEGIPEDLAGPLAAEPLAGPFGSEREAIAAGKKMVAANEE
jgi:hypothetical protein